MRILHISTRLILGGSQENTILSCIGHALHNHDTHLAFGPIYGPEGSSLPRVQQHNTQHTTQRITTHELPNLCREINIRKDRRAHKEIEQLVKDLKPDVVHTHSSKAGILGRFAAWKALNCSLTKGDGIVVHTVHGPPFHDHQSRLKNLIYTGAEQAAAKRCHAIACVADAMTTQYLQRSIGTPDLYTTIRSGMDTAPFLNPISPEDRAARRAELALSEHDTVIATVARLADLKGHDDLIHALAPLMAERPDIKLLWVGDGWKREHLENQLRALNLQDRVTITGMVPAADVPTLLKCADLMVHPSYREGLPRTVPQALLSGIPVVATDADGTPEAIDDTVTGRLVPVADRAAIAEAVRWMLDDPARAKRTAEAGRTRCAHEFDHRVMVDRLESWYQSILERIR